MKEYIVSVNFVTDISLNETDFLKAFEDQGFEVDNRLIEEGLLWRMEPLSVEEDSPLEDHMKAFKSLDLVSYLPKYADFIREIYFDLAAFFDTVYCTVTLPNEWLKLIYDLYPGIELEITTYPSNFDDDEGEEDELDDPTKGSDVEQGTCGTYCNKN